MEYRHKSQLVAVSRRLHAQGWVANHDGNASVRLGPGRIWATPTGVSKADVTEDMLVMVDDAGKRVTGRLRVFSEINLHLACFRAREEVRAVVHAHPPVATGFACAAVPLPLAMMPEAVVSIGPEIPTAPYAPPGPDAARVVGEMVQSYDAFLLGNHGALTVGADLEQAYLRMELVEHYARIARHALELGGPGAVPAADLERLLAARKKAGLGPRNPLVQPGTAPAASRALEGARMTSQSPSSPELSRLITEEISRVLKGS